MHRSSFLQSGFLSLSWLYRIVLVLVLVGGILWFGQYRSNQAQSLNLANLKRQVDQLDAKSLNNTFTAADLVTLNNLASTVAVLSTEVSDLSNETQEQLSDIIKQLANVTGKEGPQGAQGDSGVAGSQGTAGPSGTAQCAYGSCLSLQTTGSTVEEIGSLSVSGDVLAGGTVDATDFAGSGVNVTNVDAVYLNGLNAGYFTNATNLSSGTLSVSRLPSAIPATNIALGTVSDTEFGYLNGVTSAIQPQLDAKPSGSGAANRVAYWSDASTLTSDADLVFTGSALGIGATPAAATWSLSGYTQSLVLPTFGSIIWQKGTSAYSFAISAPDGGDRVNYLISTANDASAAGSLRGFWEAGTWTTAGWNKFWGLQDTSVLRWQSSSGVHWGLGGSGGSLFFMTSPASDASAAVTYQGNWTTTGLMLGGGSTVAARKLEVRSATFQQRWAVDGSSYADISVTANGLEILPTGNRIAIGLTASVSAARSIAIGNTATATATDAISMGPGAAAGGTDNSIALGQSAEVKNAGGIAIGFNTDVGAASPMGIALGYSATVVGANGIAIGAAAASPASSGIAIGSSASAGGADTSIAMGQATGVTQAGGIGIGFNADVTATKSIAIGYGATATTANTIAIGDSTVGDEANAIIFGGVTPFTNMYAGRGRVSTSPLAWTLNGTGGSGTDIAGANLVLAAGKGTGSAAPGNLFFANSTPGVSGTTLQTLTNRIVLDTNSRFGIGITSGLTGRLQVLESTAGNEVLRLESVATNDDPNYYAKQYRAATTDATVTTLGSVTLTASKTYLVEARVVARRTGGASGTAEDSASYVLRGTYKMVAGVATLVGLVSTDYSAEDQVGWDATLDTSGTDVRIRVTGAAGNNVTWHATTTLQDVGT